MYWLYTRLHVLYIILVVVGTRSLAYDPFRRHKPFSSDWGGWIWPNFIALTFLVTMVESTQRRSLTQVILRSKGFTAAMKEMIKEGRPLRKNGS